MSSRVHSELIPSFVGGTIGASIAAYLYWKSGIFCSRRKNKQSTPTTMSESHAERLTRQVAALTQSVHQLTVTVGSATRLLNRVHDDVAELKMCGHTHPVIGQRALFQAPQSDPHSLDSQESSSHPVPPAPRHGRESVPANLRGLLDVLRELAGKAQGKAQEENKVDVKKVDTKEANNDSCPADATVYTDPNKCQDFVNHVTATISQTVPTWTATLHKFGFASGLTETGLLGLRNVQRSLQNRLAQNLSDGYEFYKLKEVAVKDDPYLEYDTREAVAICKWVQIQLCICIYKASEPAVTNDSYSDSDTTDGDSDKKKGATQDAQDSRDKLRTDYQGALNLLETQFADYSTNWHKSHPKSIGMRKNVDAFASVRQLMTPIDY
jgi:hypothetical protein